MEIRFERTGDVDILHLKGKLDAFQAGEMEERACEILDKGSYRLILDLAEMDYLSSAGIRSLLKIMKKCRGLGGELKLAAISPYPLNVLKIAGFLNVFDCHPSVAAALEGFNYQGSPEEISHAREDEYRTEIGSFSFHKGSGKSTGLRVTGSNDDYLHSRCTRESISSEPLSKLKYSLGIGSLGESADDNFPYMGELMTVAGSVVWLPTDGHNTPDFLIATDPEDSVQIHTVFNIILPDDFNEVVRFSSNDKKGVSLELIYGELFRIAGERNPDFKGMLGVAMRSAMGAVFGAGIKRAPIRDNAPDNREMITHTDNIKDWLNYQLDYEFKNTTALIVGVGLDMKQEKIGSSADNVYQIDQEKKRDQYLHNHAAIFKFLPEPKNASEDLENEIRHVLQEGDFINMEHLLDKSTIKNAVIGLFYIEEITVTDK